MKYIRVYAISKSKLNSPKFLTGDLLSSAFFVYVWPLYVEVLERNL